MMSNKMISISRHKISNSGPLSYGVSFFFTQTSKKWIDFYLHFLETYSCNQFSAIWILYSTKIALEKVTCYLANLPRPMARLSCYWVIHHFLHFPRVSRLFRNVITAYTIVTHSLFGICCIRLDASVCISHRHFKRNLSKTISPFTMLMTKWKKKLFPFPWVHFPE